MRGSECTLSNVIERCFAQRCLTADVLNLVLCVTLGRTLQIIRVYQWEITVVIYLTPLSIFNAIKGREFYAILIDVHCSRPSRKQIDLLWSHSWS